MRFVSLQRFEVVPRYRGRPSLATIPLRPWTFMQHRRGSVSGRRFGPCGISPCVNRARHTPQDPRFTPVRTGHSPRSLFTRGVPLPVRRTLHDRAESTSLSIRQRSWDSYTLRSFPYPRVPAFADSASYGRSLFPPFIPTCRLLIVQHRYFLRVLAAVSELLPSELGLKRPTAKRSDRLLGLVPQASRAGRIWRFTRPILPWVCCLLSGLWICPGTSESLSLMFRDHNRAREPHTAENA